MFMLIILKVILHYSELWECTKKSFFFQRQQSLFYHSLSGLYFMLSSYDHGGRKEVLSIYTTAIK